MGASGRCSVAGPAAGHRLIPPTIPRLLWTAGFPTGAIGLDWISRAIGGWNVRMTLGGKRRSKFFADGQYVTGAAALRAAKAYRDDLVALKGEQPRPVPKPLAVVRNAVKCYQIRLPKPGGGTTTTEFSTRVHGEYNARRLAVDAYHAAVERAAGKLRARAATNSPERKGSTDA